MASPSTSTVRNNASTACVPRASGRERFDELEISVTPTPERERLLLDRADAERFAALGVEPADRLLAACARRGEPARADRRSREEP